MLQTSIAGEELSSGMQCKGNSGKAKKAWLSYFSMSGESPCSGSAPSKNVGLQLFVLLVLVLVLSHHVECSLLAFCNEFKAV